MAFLPHSHPPPLLLGHFLFWTTKTPQDYSAQFTLRPGESYDPGSGAVVPAPNTCISKATNEKVEGIHDLIRKASHWLLLPLLSIPLEV